MNPHGLAGSIVEHTAYGCAPRGGPLPSLERLCYIEPSEARLASVVALMPVVYRARVREGGTMLVTHQPVLRRFWYATVPVGHLQDGPRPFTLLNENIVLFLDADGRPAALADRCCHRTARLSTGSTAEGLLVCGYHGWAYNRTGHCVRIPQADAQAIPTDARVPAYRCAAHHGYAWVALEDPLLPLPDIPEAQDPQFRRIHQFYEVWQCASLRFLENAFDNAHFSFVHKHTFGQGDQPTPSRYALWPTAWGFDSETIVPVNNPPHARADHGRPPSCHDAASAEQVVPAVHTGLSRDLSQWAPAHHHELCDADRRPDHAAVPVALSQRYRGGLRHGRAHRLGPGDCGRGPGDPRSDGVRCLHRYPPRRRVPHGLGPAGAPDAPAAAGGPPDAWRDGGASVTGPGTGYGGAPWRLVPATSARTRTSPAFAVHAGGGRRGG